MCKPQKYLFPQKLNSELRACWQAQSCRRSCVLCANLEGPVLSSSFLTEASCGWLAVREAEPFLEHPNVLTPPYAANQGRGSEGDVVGAFEQSSVPPTMQVFQGSPRGPGPSVGLSRGAQPSLSQGCTLNTSQHVITETSHHVLSEFTILRWAAFTATLGRRRPRAQVGHPALSHQWGSSWVFVIFMCVCVWGVRILKTLTINCKRRRK